MRLRSPARRRGVIVSSGRRGELVARLLWLFWFEQRLDGFLESFYVPEVLVHADEPDVCHGVQVPETLHRRLAGSPWSTPLTCRCPSDGSLSSSGYLFQRPCRKRAFHAGLSQAGQELFPDELFAPTVLLDHSQRPSLGPLIGCEAPVATGRTPAFGGCCPPSLSNR